MFTINKGVLSTLLMSIVVGNVLAIDVPSTMVSNEAVNTSVEASVDVPKRKFSVGHAERRVRESDGESYLAWSLADLNTTAVNENDFSVAGLYIGVDDNHVRDVLGAPNNIKRGNRDVYLEFEHASVTMRSPLLHEQEVGERIGVKGSSIATGLIEFYRECDKYETKRGFSIGNSRENLIGVYGKPSSMFLDPNTTTTYYVYMANDKEMVFGVKDLQVVSIRLRLNETSLGGSDHSPYTLLGWSVGDVYKESDWAVWDTYVERDDESLWLFDDCGVVVEKSTGIIGKVFISSANVTTSYGVALGDSVSTVEHVYGKPILLEVNRENGLEVMYYVSPENRDVYLAFVVDSKTKEVEDIILTNTRLKNYGSKENRYRLN